MKKIFYLITVLLIIPSITFAQEETHRWKKLDTITGEQIWFDASFTDTLKGEKFDVWVLKVHTPPMKSEGIEGNIFRSKRGHFAQRGYAKQRGVKPKIFF